MRKLLAFLPLIAALMSGGTASAQTQTAIHHCVGANGTPVFTDRSCASLDAQPAGTAEAAQPHGPKWCPRDRHALRERIAAAFRHHDANALAGLMLWRGYDARDAMATLDRLARLVALPFQGFADADPAIPTSSSQSSGPAAGTTISVPTSAASATLPLPPSPITVILGSIATPHVRFQPIARDSCLWLSP